MRQVKYLFHTPRGVETRVCRYPMDIITETDRGVRTLWSDSPESRGICTSVHLSQVTVSSKNDVRALRLLNCHSNVGKVTHHVLIDLGKLNIHLI